MIRLLPVTLLVVAAPLFAAPPSEVIKDVCSKGNVWRLPLPPPKWSTVETPIKVDGKPEDALRICNCTPDIDGKNMGVWLRAYRSDESFTQSRKATDAKQETDPSKDGAGGAVPYYLPNLSCVRASSPTIVLGPTDKVETWGTWEPIK